MSAGERALWAPVVALGVCALVYVGAVVYVLGTLDALCSERRRR